MFCLVFLILGIFLLRLGIQLRNYFTFRFRHFGVFFRQNTATPFLDHDLVRLFLPSDLAYFLLEIYFCARSLCESETSELSVSQSHPDVSES